MLKHLIDATDLSSTLGAVGARKFAMAWFNLRRLLALVAAVGNGLLQRATPNFTR